MLTIKVYSRTTGNPAPHIAVGLGNNDGVYRETTNSNGEANFQSASPGTFEVYVGGKTVYKGHLSGEKIFYV